MRMRVIYATLVALFLVLFPMGGVEFAFAQNQQTVTYHQGPSASDIVAKMESKLNLTKDQVAAVTPIVEKYMSKHEELRQSMQDAAANQDGIRSQMLQLKADEEQGLSQVLSPDQMSLWEKVSHKQGSGGNSQGGGNGGNGGQ